MSRFVASPGPVPRQRPHVHRTCDVADVYSDVLAQEGLCTPGLLHYRCSARCGLRPRGLVSHSPRTWTDAWLTRRSTRSAVTQTCPFSGLWVRGRASTLHLAEHPLPSHGSGRLDRPYPGRLLLGRELGHTFLLSSGSEPGSLTLRHEDQERCSRNESMTRGGARLHVSDIYQVSRPRRGVRRSLLDRPCACAGGARRGMLGHRLLLLPHHCE